MYNFTPGGYFTRIETKCRAHFGKNLHMALSLLQVPCPLLAKILIDDALERRLIDQKAAALVL
jgi:hypothetical protein